MIVAGKYIAANARNHEQFGGMSVKYSMRIASVILFCSIVLLVAGCGRKEIGQEEPGPVAGETVTCIGVLPAAADPVVQRTASGAGAKSLQQGTAAMDKVLVQELQGQENVRFIGQDLLSGLTLTGGEDSLEMARMAGERIGCNTVLETVVSRFDERVGGKYSVEKPAAVAFDFRLFAIASGAVLWSATFDETQKPVTENIYEWKKAKTRGFSWVSAEGLMQEGVRAKLRDSRYFGKAKDAGQGREPAAR